LDYPTPTWKSAIQQAWKPALHTKYKPGTDRAG
jgi:hypothetical protein